MIVRKKLLIWLLAFWGIPIFLVAQDIHYSQFGYSPATTSPGLTGVFRGKFRAIANARTQWHSVSSVDYTTFSASADIKLPNRDRSRNGFWALGGNFNYDQAGTSVLQNSNLNLAASYTQTLGKIGREKERYMFLTAGVQQGIARREFRFRDLIFPVQYDPSTGNGNTGIDHGEDGLLRNSNTFGDFSAGLNFRIQDFSSCEIVNDLRERFWIDIGVGVFHLNRPNQAFEEGREEELPMRFSPYIMWNKEVADLPLDFFGHLNFQFQGPYREYLTHFGGRIYFDRVPGKQFALELSSGYRFNPDLGDTVYPAIGIQYGNVFASVAYDLNISDFEVATRNRGGFELIFRYTLNTVCLDKYFCPLL